MNVTELIISCKEGDPAALDEFARRCQPAIERLALTLLDDGRSDLLPEIREVVQETLLSAFSTPETFRDEESFTIWLYTLGVKACRKRLRLTGGHAGSFLPVTGALDWAASPPAHAAASGPVAGVATGHRPPLQLAAQALSLDLRLPLLLHYGNGLNLAQVAQVLKLSQNTLVARLGAARAALNGTADRVDFEHQMAREWIYRRLDHGLSGEDRLHLDQHLERCANCRIFEDQVRLLDRRLRADLPAIGLVRQAEGLITPPLNEWLGRQWQLRLRTQARQRQVGLVGLVLTALLGLAAYFAQPENRTPANAPSFAELSGTQTAIAVWPTATLAATPSLRVALPPPAEGRLLYEASDNRSTDLYFTRADASGRRLLDPNPSSDRAPHPSPDRRLVAFLSNRDTPRKYEIYLTDEEGNRAKRITDMAAGSPGWTGEMAWSPDSRQLVAVMDNPDPKVPFKVIRGDPVDDSRHFEGQWEGRLYIIDVETGKVTALTAPDVLAWNPAWAPDGKRVYFNALLNGYTRLVSVLVDGSDQRILTDIEGTGEQAGFSFAPNGKSLAYLVLRRSRGSIHPDALYLYDLASGRNRVLHTIPNTADIDLTLAARFSSVRWSPDGKRLVYAIPRENGQAVLRMIDIELDPNLPGVLHAGTDTVLYVGIDLYLPGHAPAWSLDSRSLGILQGRRVYVISAHSNDDNTGGFDLMEIYAGSRDEIGAGWLSWFP